MINYAHRGASEYAPENTMASFYLGLMQGANGIETDVRRSRDGVLVLFHDDRLDWVTDTSGTVSDYTWEELQRVKVFGNSTTGFYGRIPTLEAFLQAFSLYDISFAIELKEENLEAGVLELAKRYQICHKMTVTSFQFDYLKKVKALDKTVRTGWLIGNPTDEDIHKLLAIDGEEMAPKAENVTPELMEKLRKAGLGVRAWGVVNKDLMKKMCKVGVDGMTVNFPDR